MIAEVISVGTELLLGNIVNTNAQFLAEKCALLGLSMYHQTVVGDNPERLSQCIRTALDRADIVIFTGGLGPTEDDLTKEVCAQVMGLPLKEDPHTRARIQEYFQMHYGRNTVFIPNGIKRPNILKAHRITKKWGLKKDTYILYVGRLVPEKGLDYLINAFKLTKTDKKLVIAGGSSDSTEFMENLKILAKNDLRILFTGFVQGDILEELYSNAYIYILPSDLEGMPLSLLEGMSYGNCCLTSDIKECADVVENKAILFKKGNIEDLRNKIQMLCDDKRMVQSYKMTAADFICSKYNWDDVVSKTIQVYKNNLKNEKSLHK